MTLFAQMTELAGILEKGGIVGLLGAVLYVLRVVAMRYADVLEKGRTEALSDVKTERDARQNHEKQITQLLSDLVVTVKGQREAIDKLANVVDSLVDEVKRLKGQDK